MDRNGANDLPNAHMRSCGVDHIPLPPCTGVRQIWEIGSLDVGIAAFTILFTALMDRVVLQTQFSIEGYRYRCCYRNVGYKEIKANGQCQTKCHGCVGSIGCRVAKYLGVVFHTKHWRSATALVSTNVNEPPTLQNSSFSTLRCLFCTTSKHISSFLTHWG